MLKKYEEFLRSTCRVDSIIPNLVAIDIKHSLVISIAPNNKTLIFHKHYNDMRFNGVIENVHQLKLILQLVRKGI